MRGWLDGARCWRPEPWHGAPTAPGPTRRADRPASSSRSTRRTAARTSASARWPAKRGRRAAAPSWGWISVRPGARPHLLRHRAIPARGTPSSAPATTSGPRGIFARDPDTGEARWVYQWSPHDLYDYDGVNENDPARPADGGRARARCSSAPERNGYVYVLDRATGEVLSADAVRAHHVEHAASTSKTGRLIPIDDEAAAVGKRGPRHLSCRAGRARTGSHRRSRRAPGCSTSRTTTCAWTSKAVEANYIAGTPYVGANVRLYAPAPADIAASSPRGIRSARSASVEDHREVPGLERHGRDGRRRGVLRHDGGLVQGGATRAPAQLLWQFKTGSGIIGQPVTYRGPDGKQYVAVLSGVGGWAGAMVVERSRPARQTAALGWGEAMTRSLEGDDRGGMLYVFTVEGR